MAVKALIFGTDDLFPQLKPYYEREVQRGNLEIAGYAVIENGGVKLYANPGRGGRNNAKFSNCNNFFAVSFLSKNEIS